MKPKVVIVGAGVAGLTVAHELIERDFAVVVYDRRSVCGGKASSGRVGAHAGLSPGLPTEHGFRFFPGWYRHLFDSMRRIPLPEPGDVFRQRNVAHNLVELDRNLVAEYDRGPAPLVMHLPQNLEDAQAVSTFFLEAKQAGLTVRDISFFFQKLLRFLNEPEDRRREKFDGISWVDFMELDKRSRAFRSLMIATTRTMVAAKASEASAYTIAKMAIRTLFDGPSTKDRVLNGPTNEKWIDPWIRYLEEKGVEFRLGQDLDSVGFDGHGPRISHLCFRSVEEEMRTRCLRIAKECFEQLIKLRKAMKPGAADHAASLEAIAGFFAAVTHLEEILPLLESDEFRSIHAAPPDQRQGGPGVHDLDEEGRRIEAELTALGDSLASVGNDLGRARRELPGMLADLHAVRATSSAGSHAIAMVERRRDTQKAYITALEANEQAIIEARARLQARALEVQAERALRAAAPSQCLEQVRRRVEELRALRGHVAELPVDDQIEAIKRADPGDDEALQKDLAQALARERRVPPARVEADDFVFALPVEQMAYYINRSPTMCEYDPQLKRIVRLSNSLDWMSGIQFYLRDPLDITPGHIVCMDSEWGITAIEQTYFWSDVDLPSGVRSIISVDVSAWDVRGRFNRKEAFNCTPQEIAEEVWAQLEESLNKRDRRRLLERAMLIGGGLERDKSYHLDDSIVDRFDRKKQASYELSRNVKFSAEELLLENDDDKRAEIPYASGPRLAINVEPLLINRVGTLRLRPEAATGISNMFLAGDYLDTGTNLACMEGANEAARLAVNALLDRRQSRRKRCEIFPFADSGLVKTALATLGLGQRVASGGLPLTAFAVVTDSTTSFVAKTANSFLSRWRQGR
ncbi:MAG TPA: FAD-dependent oxidoreductase [Polyangia bacterium]